MGQEREYDEQGPTQSNVRYCLDGGKENIGGGVVLTSDEMGLLNLSSHLWGGGWGGGWGGLDRNK